MTVLEVIQRSTEFLAKKGVESPRLQTELLLAHLLRVPRMKLYLDFERPLTEAEMGDFRELIRRRGKREPLQHITGSISFCGLELAVSPHVLIPRPETELLAEHGWQFLHERSGPGRETVKALDFGTGSGCLAIALAVKCEVAEVLAADISEPALEIARRNAVAHQVDARIRFRQIDRLDSVAGEAPFDLLISNPPYIPTGEIEGLQPEVRDFDPRLALDGGAAGVDFFARLATGAAALLKPGGKMMLEFGEGQAEILRPMFSDENWIVESILEDYTQRPRILIARPNK